MDGLELMSYLGLGTDEPKEEPVLLDAEKAEVRTAAKTVIEKPLPPLPPQAVAHGTEGTKQPPAPTKEEINFIHQQVKDYVGQAVIDELDYKIGAIMRGYGRDVRNSMLTTAAIDTGVTLVLAMFVPVGTVISLIYSAVMAVVRALTGPGLEKAAQTIIASAQNEAAILESTWDAKLTKLQEQIIKEETPAAIKLAMAIALGDKIPVAVESVEGLGNIALALQLWAVKKEKEFQESLKTMTPEEQEEAKAERKAGISKAAALYLGTNKQAQAQISKQFENTVTDLQEKLGMREPEESTMDRLKTAAKGEAILGTSVLYAAGIPPGALTAATFHPDVRVQAAALELAQKASAWQKGTMEYVSGHIVVTKAKEAARLILEQTRLKIIARYTLAKGRMEQPEFRANLRLAIAQQILMNPEIQKMLAGTMVAREQLQKSLTPADVPAIENSPLPKKPKTGLILGGGAAAALAFWYLS